MANKKGETLPQADPSGATSIMERRRTGRIVHDERGNARIEWVDAPPEDERTSLSLEQTQPTQRPDHGYNPYGTAARDPRKSPPPAAGPAGSRPRRDLRKLSEWIKQMRELEERKRKEGDD